MEPDDRDQPAAFPTAAEPASNPAPDLPPVRLAASPPPLRRRIGKWLIGAITVLMVGCVLLLIDRSIPEPVDQLLIVTLAVVPALFYSWIVLSLDRYEKEPRRAIIACFGWGAVGAILFSLVAELAFGGLVVAAVGEDAGTLLTIGIGAPIIEEAFKGVALLALLWWFRREFDNVLDGLVYGALIGLGFAMTENIFYFGSVYLEDGARALGELFIVRAIIDGFGHASYTATTGAAVGWARSRYDRGAWQYIVPVIGYALAVFQHFLWNTGLIVIAGIQGEDASIWSVVLIEAPLFLLPSLVVLYLIARTSSRRELMILQEELRREVDAGVLTPAEHRLLTTSELRDATLTRAEARGGKPLRATVQRFYQVAAELAFRRYHLSRGELPKPGQRAEEESYRAELAALRGQMRAVGFEAASG